MCCYRRTHWGWSMTLACSGWSFLPAMICAGLVRGMQARPASTGTESSSSSTRTSLQPMTSCRMTSRWTHAPCTSAPQCCSCCCHSGALCGYAHTSRHGWSCYIIPVWSCYVLPVTRLPKQIARHFLGRTLRRTAWHEAFRPLPGVCCPNPIIATIELQQAMQVTNATLSAGGAD